MSKNAENKRIAQIEKQIEENKQVSDSQFRILQSQFNILQRLVNAQNTIQTPLQFLIQQPAIPQYIPIIGSTESGGTSIKKSGFGKNHPENM